MSSPAPTPPKPQTAVPRRTLAWLAPAMVLPFAASVVYFDLLPGTWVGQGFYAAVKAFMLAYPLLALRPLGSAPRNEGLLQRWNRHWPVLAEGAASGLLIGGAILIAFYFTPLGDLVRAAAPTLRAKVHEIGFTDHVIFYSLFIALTNSLLEEYYWRWFLCGRLRQIAPFPVAAVVSAVAFSAHHFIVVAAYFPLPLAVACTAGVALGGLIWAIQYRRHGSLLGAWLSHALVDAAILWVGCQVIFKN